MTQHYLLDTNVLSELMRPHPDSQVLAWFAAHVSDSMHVCATTQAEILTGVALLPAGKKRTSLSEAAQIIFEQDFGARCLPFDAVAAQIYGALVARRTRAGKAISTEDAQIAAVALQHKLQLVTRNTKDFTGIESLQLANPWHPTPTH